MEATNSLTSLILDRCLRDISGPLLKPRCWRLIHYSCCYIINDNEFKKKIFLWCLKTLHLNIFCVVNRYTDRKALVFPAQMVFTLCSVATAPAILIDCNSFLWTHATDGACQENSNRHIGEVFLVISLPRKEGCYQEVKSIFHHVCRHIVLFFRLSLPLMPQITGILSEP